MSKPSETESQKQIIWSSFISPNGPGQARRTENAGMQTGTPNRRRLHLVGSASFDPYLKAPLVAVPVDARRPIARWPRRTASPSRPKARGQTACQAWRVTNARCASHTQYRSEEHTSELQSL